MQDPADETDGGLRTTFAQRFDLGLELFERFGRFHSAMMIASGTKGDGRCRRRLGCRCSDLSLTLALRTAVPGKESITRKSNEKGALSASLVRI